MNTNIFNSTPTSQNANPFAGVPVKASSAEPLPPGIYFADFKGVEPFTNERVANKWKWTWEVATGTQKGRSATALTDQSITMQNHAGRLLVGLLGRSLSPGEDTGALWAELQRCVGKRFAVTVAMGPKGGKASVQNVSPPPEM
jgi:hypothetical protein